VTGPIRLARQTPVAACVDLLAIEPLLVRANDDLLVVVRRSAQQPSTRLIGVVDDAGILRGVLPILRLAEAVVGRVVPEALLTDIADSEDVAQFGHTVEARTVADVMIQPATAKPTDTIADAFRRMHRRQLSGLYVVDESGRPTGYLDLLELALRYADAIQGTSGGDGDWVPTGDGD
jgi:CBS domain-containing protein